jgi:hypothetical protein
MSTTNAPAAQAGSYRVGDVDLNRIGYGADRPRRRLSDGWLRAIAGQNDGWQSSIRYLGPRAGHVCTGS